MITLDLARPWLRATLPPGFRVLSHAPHGAGYLATRSVLWREVRNAALGPDVDAEGWFAAQMAGQMAGQGGAAAVGMITSRDIGTFTRGAAVADGVRAEAVVTLGLSNAESVGRRLPWHPADGSAGFGTVNILVALDLGLTRVAQLEALAVAVQARTAAILDLGLMLPTGPASGTGTDCMALACRPGRTRYAGLHTAAGEAVGSAVRAAVARAGQDWMIWRKAQGQAG